MKKKILVVDDDRDLAGDLAELLNMKGYEAVCAFDGEEGYERVLEADPDLIITDFNMPIMDGYGLSKKLRDNDYKCPIVLLSGYSINYIKNIYPDIEKYVTSYFDKDEGVDKLLNILEKELQKSTLGPAQGQ